MYPSVAEPLLSRTFKVAYSSPSGKAQFALNDFNHLIRVELTLSDIPWVPNYLHPSPKLLPLLHSKAYFSNYHVPRHKVLQHIANRPHHTIFAAKKVGNLLCTILHITSQSLSKRTTKSRTTGIVFVLCICCSIAPQMSTSYITVASSAIFSCTQTRHLNK